VAAFGLPAQQNRQPQSPVGHNQREIGKYGLVGGFVAGESMPLPRSIATGAPITRSNASFGFRPVPNSKGDGLAAQFYEPTSGTGNYSDILLRKAIVCNSMTFMARVRYNTFATPATLFVRDEGGINNLWVWRPAGTSNFRWRIVGSDSTAIAGFNLDTWWDIDTVGATTGLSFLVNGEVATTASFASSTCSITQRIGACSGAIDYAGGEVDVEYLLWFDRVLTTVEMREVRANPHRFFNPIERRIWVPSAAAPSSFIPAWVRRGSHVIGGR
jgi:hypothetical protein